MGLLCILFRGYLQRGRLEYDTEQSQLCSVKIYVYVEFASKHTLHGLMM